MQLNLSISERVLERLEGRQGVRNEFPGLLRPRRREQVYDGPSPVRQVPADVQKALKEVFIVDLHARLTHFYSLLH